MGKTIINFADANLFDARERVAKANENVAKGARAMLPVFLEGQSVLAVTVVVAGEKVVQQADLEEWSSMKMDIQIMTDNPL